MKSCIISVALKAHRKQEFLYDHETSQRTSLPVIRQKGESENGCFKKTKHVKFFKKTKISYPLIRTLITDKLFPLFYLSIDGNTKRLEYHVFCFIYCVNVFGFDIQLTKKSYRLQLFLCKTLVFPFLPFLNFGAQIRCSPNWFTDCKSALDQPLPSFAGLIYCQISSLHLTAYMNMVLHFKFVPEKFNDINFQKLKKTTQLWGHFWPFLSKIGPMKICLEKQGPSVSSLHKVLDSSKNSEKYNF